MDLENLEDKSFDLSGDFTDALSFISASPDVNNFTNETNDAGNIQPMMPQMISQCLIEEQRKRQVAQQLSAQQSQSQAYVSHQQQQNNHQQFFSQQQPQISQVNYQQQQYQRSTIPKVQNHQSAQFHQSMTHHQRILAYQQQMQYNNSPSPPPQIPNQQPMVPRNFIPQQQQQQQYKSSPSPPPQIQNQQPMVPQNFVQQQQYKSSPSPPPQIQNQQPMVPRNFVPQQQHQQQYKSSPSPPPQIQNQQPMVSRHFVTQQQHQQLPSQANQLETQGQQRLLAANQQQYQRPTIVVPQIQNQQMQRQNQQFENQNSQVHQTTSILRQQLSQASHSVTQQHKQQQRLQIQNQQALLQNQQMQAHQSRTQSQAPQSLPQQQNLHPQLHIQKQQAQLQNLKFEAQNQQTQAHQLESQLLNQQQNLQQQLQIQKQQTQAHQRSASPTQLQTPDQRFLSGCQLKYQAQDLSQSSRNFAAQPQPTAQNQQPSYSKIRHQQQPVNPSQQPRQPYIEIVEQPATRGSRFRYGCEVRENGSIPGVSSTPDCKTYPTIRIVGYNGSAKIVASCVTKDPPYLPHPHNLVGKNWCKGGVCVYSMRKDQMTVSFEKLGIQCVKRKEFCKSLEMREKIKCDPFKTGFEHKNELNSIDQSCVRLAFQVFIEGPARNEYKIALPPVVSNPIYDRKNSPDLTIYHMSHSSAPADGGLKMILLCDKVAKDDIQIKFYEEQDEEIVWEEYGNLRDYGIIHKNVAILFQTPRYRTIDICNPVSVFVELIRPSDGMSSNALQFDFTRVETDPIGMQRKRKRVDESLLKSLEVGNIHADPRNLINHSNLNIIEAR